MHWEVLMAKNGEQTLRLNDVLLYSRYRPREDAWKWIDAEFDATKSCYLLIGLGLGYHAERLIELAGEKQVDVYYFEQKELELTPIKQAVSDISHIDFQDCQILIPNVWIKALANHPILPFLEDIKINQITFKKSATLMKQNFDANITNYNVQPYPTYTKKNACLVASGPSLNETIHWLKVIEHSVDIFVVGSALKMLLNHDITPSATIISDSKPNIMSQLDGGNYNGDLYFLSTANAQTVNKHQGTAFILCQQGYIDAELLAEKYKLPLIETGGSVSTTAISLLELLDYEKIILFGQDMGFSGEQTHATGSTSGRTVTNDLNIRQVNANDGSEIWTTPNLQVYARWIEQKVKRMQAKLYTTSKNGVAIQGVPFITKQQLEKMLF